jgi:predicted Fe-Mo cluster-binding NifX family protein
MMMRIAIPTTGKRKLTNKVADTFSRAPHFTIVTIEDNQIKTLDVVPNPGEIPERGAGPLAARLLKENQVGLLLTSEVGPGARNILEALEIEIDLVEEGKTVKEVVAAYL